MSGLKGLVGKKLHKTVKCMGQDLTIKKLSVAEVMEIQAASKEAGEDEKANFDLLKLVIKLSAEGAEEMADEEFDNFPIDDLSKLSTDIMKFSGVGATNPPK